MNKGNGPSENGPQMTGEGLTAAPILATGQVPAVAQLPQVTETNGRSDRKKDVTERDKLAARFHALFAGCERAYGTYDNIDFDRRRSDGKFKGDAVTKRAPVTAALWDAHLAGKSGLGIIPIRDDNTVVFGAIDVDVYQNLDHGRVASTVARLNLPLVTCRSKSGGVHLYSFAQCPVSAADMQARLQEIAARLGFGTAEVYPKQTRMGGDRDLGSWINMPYQNVEGTVRYAVRANGDAMTAEEFLDAAEAAKQPAAWFAQPMPQAPDTLPDGPPCLQHLMELGFPAGTWNSGTFNLGVYCRKAFPDDWKARLTQLNVINFPPDKWPSSDLDSIIKSVGKKDYAYQCGKHPLLEHCDRTTCRTRKYGISGASVLPVLSSLSKLLTDPPIWFLEVEGHRLELTTEELLNPLAFQVKCANHDVIVPVVGRAAWTEYLRPAMASVNRIPVADDESGDDDSSSRALFAELLESFCCGRAQGHCVEDVRMGRPYTEDGVTKFRLTDLMTFILRRGFKGFQRHEVAAMLKGMKATNRQERIGGKPTRLWTVREYSGDESPLPMPDAINDPKPF